MASPRRMPSMVGYGSKSHRVHQPLTRPTTQGQPTGADKGHRWQTGAGTGCASASSRPASTRHHRSPRAGLPDRAGALVDDHITLCRCQARSRCRSACRRWPSRGDFDALIALGCIIRGETYHFELVANESGAGSRVALDHQIHRQCHPHHREPGTGQAPADGHKGTRRRPRGGGDGQPAGRAGLSLCPKPARQPAHRPDPGWRSPPARPPQVGAQPPEFALPGAVPAPRSAARTMPSCHRPFTRDLSGFQQGRRSALRRAVARLHPRGRRALG